MTIGIFFYILFVLFIKHFIIDFPIYTNYSCRNEKIHKSALWYLHIVAHGAVTFLLLWLISIPFWIVVFASLLDLVVHFVIDFLFIYLDQKAKENEHFRKKAHWLVDIDQYLHCFFYAILTFSILMLL